MLALTVIAASSAITGCGGSSSSNSAGTSSSPSPVTVTPDNFILTTFARQTYTGQSCNHNGEFEQLNDTFVDIAPLVGLDYTHGMENGDNLYEQSGGVGAGDFNNDGWVDLYAVGGDDGPSLLLTNTGVGTFLNQASKAGVDTIGKGSGPSFGDFNGDGNLDLFVGNVDDGIPRLFVNNGDETFTDITQQSGLELPGNNISAAWGDYDSDNDLDLIIAHWSLEISDGTRFLWRNNGDLTFTDVSTETNLMWLDTNADLTFTPGFADINSDGNQDILFVADGRTSRVFLNQENGVFLDLTDSQISDRSGMGSAIADYDNDGDLDWFVSSISRGRLDKNGIFGNRLYQNQGDGFFIDVTEDAGVREGHWGWGACFSDFNNDGNLDIFHVNGMFNQTNFFLVDPSVLFISNGDGTFSDKALEMGIDDTGMGRGVVCFDYDRDGDQDIFIANYNEPPKLFCNYGNDNNFVNIRLEGTSPNTQALGARIYVTTNERVQMRELNANSNYVSQNPVEAHFGLSDATIIDEIRIVWNDTNESVLENVEINQFLHVKKR